VKNLTTGTSLVAAVVAGGSPLDAGQSRAEQYTFKLPDGNISVGDIQFSVTVDSTDTVFEYNAAGTGEANNTTSIKKTASLAAYPDLVVQNVTFNPSTGVKSGSALQVQWDDVNAGNAPTTGSWSDRLVVQNTTTGQTLATVTLYYDAAANGALAGG